MMTLCHFDANEARLYDTMIHYGTELDLRPVNMLV